MKYASKKTNRIISIILSLILTLSVFSIMPMSVSAAEGDRFTVGDITYEITGSSTVGVRDIGHNETVVIPDTVEYNGEQYTVTTLESYAVNSYDAVVNLVLPSTLEGMNDTSFMNCLGLEQITINSPLTIKNSAWKYKLNIRNLYCNDRNIVFEEKALDSCTRAKSNDKYGLDFVLYGYAGSTAETYAKNNKIKFVDYDNPLPVQNEEFVVDGFKYRVKDDGKTAAIFDFEGKNDVTSITFPGTVSYKGVNLPTGICNYALSENTNIKEVVFSEGAEKLFPNTFSKSAIEKVVFPKSFKKISDRAFAGCSSLKEVVINSDVELGRYAFLNCTALENLYCYAENINFDDAFKNFNAENLTIHGYPGSTAEAFATSNNVKFVPLDKPVEYIDVMLGDADGNGRISIIDATLIQKHIAKLGEIASQEAQLAADVNGDKRISVLDATFIQKHLANFDIDYPVGEIVSVEVPEPIKPDPQPTDPQPTDPQPTDPQPTDPQPTDPDEKTITLYLPNIVSWLTNDGGKMWVYNDDTSEFLVMSYDAEAETFFADIPEKWVNLSYYRTPYDTIESNFDINSPWDETTQTGVILNKWVNLDSRGSNNCFMITADGEGTYKMYTPSGGEETNRTIYFDNSITKWDSVYIYIWSFGYNQTFFQLEDLGNDIWSFTFPAKDPTDGVKGFLFVNQDSWSGQTQTGDLATVKDKNLYVPKTPGSTNEKVTGTWDVYTPAK